MRVRVVQTPAALSSTIVLAVQRWSSGQWEHVMNFALHESEQASEFAMKLSLTKREPTEVAVFEDGEKVESRTIPPHMYHIESHQGASTEKVPES